MPAKSKGERSLETSRQQPTVLCDTHMMSTHKSDASLRWSLTRPQLKTNAVYNDWVSPRHDAVGTPWNKYYIMHKQRKPCYLRNKQGCTTPWNNIPKQSSWVQQYATSRNNLSVNIQHLISDFRWKYEHGLICTEKSVRHTYLPYTRIPALTYFEPNSGVAYCMQTPDYGRS